MKSSYVIWVSALILSACTQESEKQTSHAISPIQEQNMETPTIIEPQQVQSVQTMPATQEATQAQKPEVIQEPSHEDLIREKAIAAVPTVKLIMDGDVEPFFKRHGYKINKRKEYDDSIGEYSTLITATLDLGHGIYLQYKERLWKPLEFTIKGIPEARDKFFKEAKQYVASEKKKSRGDHWTDTWYAKLSGDKIIINLLAD